MKQFESFLCEVFKPTPQLFPGIWFAEPQINYIFITVSRLDSWISISVLFFSSPSSFSPLNACWTSLCLRVRSRSAPPSDRLLFLVLPTDSRLTSLWSASVWSVPANTWRLCQAWQIPPSWVRRAFKAVWFSCWWAARLLFRWTLAWSNNTKELLVH